MILALRILSDRRSGDGTPRVATIIHKGRPHWIVFGWAILRGLLSARSRLTLTNRRVVLKTGILWQEVQRVSIAHHRIRLGRVSCHRPSVQLRHSDRPWLRRDSGLIKRISEARARAGAHPATAVPCPTLGAYLEKRAAT